MDLPEEVRAWVEKHDSGTDAELVDVVMRAVDKFVAPGSELGDLWEESGDTGEWYARVGDPRARLER